MTQVVWLVVIVALGIAIALLRARQLQLARAEHIRNYRFPAGLLDKFSAHYPQLDIKDRHLVTRALRQFFLAYLRSGLRPVSMPSQVVDSLWHEFILYTRHYQQFCDKAFGQFLHHSPAVILTGDRSYNTGLRRMWWFSCLEENINPKHPSRLPLLFAIDAKLAITNGFHYSLDCRRQDANYSGGSSTPYCAGDFSDTSYDGSTDGFGDGGDSGSDGGSDGGCGGGCGGD